MENVVNSSFWRGKKVFLTGHTGFKGSWLSLWLQHWGADVIGYSLTPPTSPSLFVVANVGDGMKSIIADIRDLDKLKKATTDAQPEILIHMAAQPLVRLSYEEPVDTFTTNVMGTVNVLEAARATTSLRVILNVTSDKCYENRERAEGYREDEAMGGYDPYSSSKGCAELITAAYRKSFFDTSKIGVASGRAGNVIGGGDWAMDRLIPDIFRAISDGKSVSIRNPKSIRPWQHVLEPLGGYLTLCQALYENPIQFSEGFNFGPSDSDAREVEWIVKEILKLNPSNNGYILQGSANEPHEAKFLKLNCEKAKSKLDWTPKWNLKSALEKIAAWNLEYKQRPEGMKQVCLNQISEYLQT